MLVQRVVHRNRPVVRDEQLPAELTDVGHPGGPDPAARHVDRPAGGEREGLVVQGGTGQPGQELARPRAHHAEHREVAREVVDVDDGTVLDVLVEPREVADRRGGAGDDEELVVGGASDGHVGLVGAAGIEPRRVDGLADRDVDVVGTDPLERAERVGTGDGVLAEGRLVEDRDRGAAGHLLGGAVLQPLRPVPAVVQRRAEVQGPFPAVAGAERRPGGDRTLVQRREPDVPRGLGLAVGPGDGVVEPEDLGNAAAQPGLVGGVRREAAHVDPDEVHRRLAVDDPLGQRSAGPARRRDADRVEAGPDEVAGQPGRLAQQELVVGREALGTVVELADPDVLQGGDALDGSVHEDREVVPVLVEELELERVRDLRGRHPGLGHRLEAADHQSADLLLDVDVAVGVAQDRQVGVHTLELVGDDVEVLGRVQRDGDADLVAERLGPLARTVDDDLGLDVTGVRAYAGDAPSARGRGRVDAERPARARARAPRPCAHPWRAPT